MKKYFVIVLLTVMALAPRSVFALQVAPTYQMFALSAGEKIHGELTLTNNDDLDINVEPGTKEWFTSTINKNLKPDDWLKVSRDQFVLKAGESKRISFSVVAPKKAVGELNAMLSFETKKQNSPNISFRLSVAIYATIKGTEKVQGQVGGVAVIPSSDTTVAVLVQNPGNVHLRPRGFVEIRDTKGQQVANVEIDQGAPVFPGMERPFEGRIRNFRIPTGEYVAHISMMDIDTKYQMPLVKKKFVVKDAGKVEENKK
jgi:hypothetical protein